MSARDVATSLRTAPTPRIEYRQFDARAPLPKDVLCAVAFGDVPVQHDDPRCVRVRLKPLRGAGLMEVWHANGPVSFGFDGALRYAADADHLLGAIEVDERQYGGIVGATEFAYAALSRLVSSSRHPHLLRVWNYLDDINNGSGDDERYKLFCVGRAAGLRSYARGDVHPAATCIGRRDGNPTLQVYCLAGRAPGVALENPRQTSAYRYPRQYGPVAPSFSRAMLVSDRLVMISGTASIVGHASRHPGDARAQLEETLRNLANVLQRAAGLVPGITPRLGAESLLKIYLRDESLLPDIEATVRQHLPAQTPLLILHADVCRAELLVEADCLHGGL
jgi:chorismate lyase/3-hydroxybenzoate synthase